MAWLSRNSFTPSDKLHADDLNNLANDDRTWGGDVNGGGHILSNVQLVGIIETAVAVSSVFGRTGDVIAVAGDYTADQVGAVPLTRLVSPGVGLSGGGALSADITLSVDPDTTNQRVAILSEGVAVATRPAMNFVEGANVAVSITDNPGANRVDVAISSSGGGGGGGMVDPTTTIGDLIVRGSAAPNRFPVGLDGQVLTADGASPLHMKWAASSGGGSQTPWVSDIDAAGHKLTGVANVGIGTAAPSSPLSVTGVAAAAALPAATFTNSAPQTNVGQTVRLRLAPNGGFVGAEQLAPYVAGVTEATNGSSGLAFGAYSLGTLAEAVRISAAGNVGIGTTAPATTLDVNGTVTVRGNIVIRTNYASLNYQDPQVAVNAGGLIRFTSGGAGSWGFQTNTAAAGDFGSVLVPLTLSATGNVGIGTQFPTRSLDVLGGLALRPGSYSGGATELNVTNQSTFILSGTGGNNFTGLIGGVDGAIVTILNVCSAAVTFLPANAGSATANQMRMNTGVVSAVVKPYGAISFCWCGAIGQWVMIALQSI